jgi:regulator of replication initiation timing
MSEDKVEACYATIRRLESKNFDLAMAHAASKDKYKQLLEENERLREALMELVRLLDEMPPREEVARRAHMAAREALRGRKDGC